MNGTKDSSIVDVFCSSCQAFLVNIPNRWWQVTKSHVTVLSLGKSQDNSNDSGVGLAVDRLFGVRVGQDDFDGSGELLSCILRILECRQCDRRLGIKCTRAPEEKAHHRNNYYFKDSRINLKETSSGEPVVLNIVASTADMAQSPSVIESSMSRHTGSNPGDQGAIFDGFDGANSFSLEPKSRRTEPHQHSTGFPLAQRPQQLIKPTLYAVPSTNPESEQRNSSNVIDQISASPKASDISNLDLRLHAILKSQAANIAKMMQTLETLQRDVDYIKCSITSSTTSAMQAPSFLKRKSDFHKPAPIELSDSSRESSRQRELIRPRPSKFARTYRSPLEGDSAVAAALQRLRGMDDDESQADPKSPLDTAQSGGKSISKQDKSSREHETMFKSTCGSKDDRSNTLQQDSEIQSNGHLRAASTDDVVMSNPSNQISRETQEYLDKAIVEDPNDMDYVPSSSLAGAPTTKLPEASIGKRLAPATAPGCKLSPSDSTESAPQDPLETLAKEGVVPQPDPLAPPVRPIESLGPVASQSSRGGKRPGAGRSRKNLAIGDGRLTPEWEREDWDPESYVARIKDPAYKNKPPPRKAIARRGISRGGMPTSKPFDSRVKPKHLTTTPTSSPHPRSAEKPRDEEGFILLPSGQRDGRSTRWRKRVEQQQQLQPREAKSNTTPQKPGEDGDTIELAKPANQANQGAQTCDEKQAVDEKQGNQVAQASNGMQAGHDRSKDIDSHAKIMAKIFPKNFGARSTAGP